MIPRHSPPNPDEYVKLAGPYRRYELHLLERAMVQLGPIDHAISRDKYGLWLWRSKQGYLDTY